MNITELQQQAYNYLAQDQYQDAIALYEKCLELDPYVISHYWYLGLALLLSERELEAQTIWMSVIMQGDPEQIDNWTNELIEILSGKARQQLQTHKFLTAKKLYLQLLDLDESFADAYLGLGIIAMENAQLDEAISYLQKANMLNSGSFLPAYYLAYCFQKKGDLNQALTFFQDVSTKNQNLPDVDYSIGLIRREKGNIKLAITYFKKAINANPNYVEAYYHLGCSYKEINLNKEAVLHLQKATHLNPELGKGHLLLGACFLQLGELEKAIESTQKAIKFNADKAIAYYNIGFCFRDLGKIDQAINSFQESLKYGLEEAKNRLEELRKFETLNYSPRVREGYGTWDAILFKDEDIYRLFYLTGTRRAIPYWTVGEIDAAISTDLNQWQYLGTVLKPHQAFSCKGGGGRMLAGSVYKENAIYYFFYSADPRISLDIEEGIGLAKSLDAIHWECSDEPLIEPNPCYYGSSSVVHQGKQFSHCQWRDPYLFKDPVTEKYYLFFAASVKQGYSHFQGCVGLAIADHIQGPYQVLPPICYPVIENNDGIYYEMERPQVIYKDGKYHLFFSSGSVDINQKWLSSFQEGEVNQSTLYWFVSDKITEPFQPAAEKPWVKGSNLTGLYGTNFIESPNGQLIAYGCYYHTSVLEVSPRFIVSWENNSIEILNSES